MILFKRGQSVRVCEKTKNKKVSKYTSRDHLFTNARFLVLRNGLFDAPHEHPIVDDTEPVTGQKRKNIHKHGGHIF